MSQITPTPAIDFGQRTPRIEALQTNVDQWSSQSQYLKFAAGFTACAALTTIRLTATPVRVTLGVGFIASTLFSFLASKKHDSYEAELNRLVQLRQQIKKLHEMNPQIQKTHEAQKKVFQGILKQLFEAVDKEACTRGEALAFINAHVQNAILNKPRNYLNYLIGFAELNQEKLPMLESTKKVIHEALREKWRALVKTDVVLDWGRKGAWIKALYTQGRDYKEALGFDGDEFEKICNDYCSRLFNRRINSGEPLYCLGEDHKLCIYGAEILQYVPEEGEIRTWVIGQIVKYMDAQAQNSSIKNFANIPSVRGNLLKDCTLTVFAQFLSGERSYVKLREIVGDFKEALEAAKAHMAAEEFSQLEEKLIAGVVIERFKRELGFSSDTIDISKDHEYLGASDSGKAQTVLQPLAIQHQRAHVNFLITYIDQKEVSYNSPSRFVNDPMDADSVYKICKVEFEDFVSSHKIRPDFGSMPFDTAPEKFERSESYLPEKLKTELRAARDTIKELDQTSREASKVVYEKLGEQLESVTISADLQGAIDVYNTELTFSMEWPNRLREFASQREEIASQIKTLKNRNRLLGIEVAGRALKFDEGNSALKGKHKTELNSNKTEIEKLETKDAAILAAIEAGEKRLKDKTLQAAYDPLKKLIEEHNKPLHEKYAKAENDDKQIAADTAAKTKELIAAYTKALEDTLNTHSYC